MRDAPALVYNVNIDPRTHMTIQGGIEEIDRLRAENEELKAALADWESSAEKAAGETCGDERHCTCVPSLRKKLADLQELVMDLKNWHDDVEGVEPCILCDGNPSEGKGHDSQCMWSWILHAAAGFREVE